PAILTAPPAPARLTLYPRLPTHHLSITNGPAILLQRDCLLRHDQWPLQSGRTAVHDPAHADPGARPAVRQHGTYVDALIINGLDGLDHSRRHPGSNLRARRGIRRRIERVIDVELDRDIRHSDAAVKH